MKRRSGFVLMAALWLLIALGSIGLDVSLRSRTRRLATANLLDETRARTTADAATEYARSRLTAALLGRADQLRSEAGAAATTAAARNRAGRMDMQTLFRQSDPALDPWREPQALVQSSFVLADIAAGLELRDTGAALNLNEADETMLLQFLAQGLRLDYALAGRLTQAILDWRDQDDLPRVNGGENEEYTEDGAAVLPANRPFAEIAELRYVRGMTREVFEQMKPYLTLVGSGRINVNAAPEAVLLALPGFTPIGVTALLRMRESGRLPRNERELRDLMPNSAGLALTDSQGQFNRRVAYATDEIEITAVVDLERSPVSARATVVVARASDGAQVIWRKID